MGSPEPLGDEGTISSCFGRLFAHLRSSAYLTIGADHLHGGRLNSSK